MKCIPGLDRDTPERDIRFPYIEGSESLDSLLFIFSGRFFVGYRTFCVFFNVNEASVYRALLAFIFSEKIFDGGQKVL